MKHFRILFPTLIIFSFKIIIFSSCASIKQLKITPENAEVMRIMKEELDKFRIEMTSSFMEAHTRRKRAALGEVTDLSINDNFIEALGEPVGPFSVFSFANVPYLIKRDGIYMLMSVLDDAMDEGDGQSLEPRKVSSFNLQRGELVLHGIEWENNFFLLTSNGGFSTIYTIHQDSLAPIFRQRIQNKANGVHGHFFVFEKNLYMIIANDNALHSTTFTPVFRWAGSYMDEIHQVQTTGASALETFEINGKKYLAIAQSTDSKGNTLLGTIVLSMDKEDNLERVQLLWSNGANSLHHMHTEKEHFLLVGQENEPAIAYWFGGIDFISWQQFKGIQGQNLKLNGWQMTVDDPVFVASSNDGNIQVFTRSASTTKKMTTWVPSKSLNAISLTRNERTSKVEFLHVQDRSFLVVTNALPDVSLESHRFYKLTLTKTQLAVSRTKEPGDKLSQCLHVLSMNLDDSQEVLQRISEVGPTVLTTDKNVDFEGTIVSKEIVKKDPENTRVSQAHINPDPEFARAGSDPVGEFSAPSELLARIEKSNDELELMKNDLNKILYKQDRNSKHVTGNLKFKGPVQFSNFHSSESTNLIVDSINNVRWEDLDNFVLKTESEEHQIVTGTWTLESLETEATKIVNKDSKLVPHNFMLQTCPQDSGQSVSGHQIFNKEIKLSNLNVLDSTEINDISFSRIVMKNNPNQEIRGYKHAPFLQGDFQAQNVNDKHLPTWFSSVAKLASSEPQHFSGPVTFTDQAGLRIDNLNVENLNGQNWNDFRRNIMIDGENQIVDGLMEFGALRVDNLKSDSILGVKSDSLLTSDTMQDIKSHLTFEKVEIDGPLSTQLINGISLTDAVNKNEREAVINGPVVLEDFSVEDVHVAEERTIAGMDVSKLSALKRVHSYTTADGSPIFLKNVNVKTLRAQKINGHALEDFEKSKYWSHSPGNVVTSPQLLLDDRAVFVLSDKFETHHLNDFSFPDEFVSLEQNEIRMKTPLRFEQPVTVLGEVTLTDGATIEGIDMSKVQSEMVDSNFKGIIRGRKTFVQDIIAEHGASFKSLNGIDPLKDAVFLKEEGTQTIDGIITFQDGVQVQDNFQIRDGSMDVGGTVNDMRLDEIGRTTVYKDRENVVEGKIIFQKGVSAENFSTVKLNDRNIQQIMSNMIFLHSPDLQTIEQRIEIQEGTVDFKGDTFTPTINGVNLLEYLTDVVRLDAAPLEMIKDTKTFHNAVFNNQLTCSSFGGVDMKDLETNALSKTKAQTITGKWSLDNAEFLGVGFFLDKNNLKTESIGEVPLDNIVFTDEPFEINSPVMFTSERETTIQGPLSVTGDVNGITFDDNLKNFLTINDVDNFDHVTITGDLEWAKDQPEMQRLSYLFNNAVKTSGPQRISGNVQFSEGFVANELSSGNKWFHGVDMKDIKNDAIMMDDSTWVLSGLNEFEKPLRIQNLVQPVNVLDVTDVNGLDLMKINDDIVKESDFNSERRIQGTKTMEGRVTVHDLEVQDKISDVSVNDIVVKNDEREISQINFHDVEVEDNISWEKTEGIDLQSLLNDRVSLTTPGQTLQGQFTFQKVDVLNQCSASMINNIKTENVLRRDMQKFPQISGQKTFNEGLIIQGELDTATLNDHSIQDIMESTLRVDRKEIIERPVIFQKPVTLNKEVNVETVNEVHLETFSSEVAERVARLMKDARRPVSLEAELQEQTSLLRRIAKSSPSWFEYLRMKNDWTEMGEISRVGSIMKRQLSGEIFISFVEKSLTDGQIADVSQGCSCNKVKTVILKENDIKSGSNSIQKIVGEDSCLQVFHVKSPSGKLYSILSDSVSSNVSCISSTEETTKIMTEDRLIGEMKLGHLSDVNVFTDRGQDFLVMAQYFDRDSKSHTTSTKVVHIAPNGLLEEVQDIESHGARKIALSEVNDQWMLAIANSKNPQDETSCNSESSIYQWSSEDQMFLLLRNVMTDGVFDVAFITSETSNEFYKQSFVAFAQEGNSASGEIMILKYKSMDNNFVMAQTIRSKWPVSALRSTCMCQQCFLVTAVPQEGITFYENRFVEGFQPYYKAPVFGARDIMHFTSKDKHLFAISTSKGPILAEGVMAGSCAAN